MGPKKRNTQNQQILRNVQQIVEVPARRLRERQEGSVLQRAIRRREGQFQRLEIRPGEAIERERQRLLDERLLREEGRRQRMQEQRREQRREANRRLVRNVAHYWIIGNQPGETYRAVDEERPRWVNMVVKAFNPINRDNVYENFNPQENIWNDGIIDIFGLREYFEEIENDENFMQLAFRPDIDLDPKFALQTDLTIFSERFSMWEANSGPLSRQQLAIYYKGDDVTPDDFYTSVRNYFGLQYTYTMENEIQPYVVQQINQYVRAQKQANMLIRRYLAVNYGREWNDAQFQRRYIDRWSGVQTQNQILHDELENLYKDVFEPLNSFNAVKMPRAFMIRMFLLMFIMLKCNYLKCKRFARLILNADFEEYNKLGGQLVENPQRFGIMPYFLAVCVDKMTQIQITERRNLGLALYYQSNRVRTIANQAIRRNEEENRRRRVLGDINRRLERGEITAAQALRERDAVVERIQRDVSNQVIHLGQLGGLGRGWSIENAFYFDYADRNSLFVFQRILINAVRKAISLATWDNRQQINLRIDIKAIMRVILKQQINDEEEYLKGISLTVRQEQARPAVYIIIAKKILRDLLGIDREIEIAQNDEEENLTQEEYEQLKLRFERQNERAQADWESGQLVHNRIDTYTMFESTEYQDIDGEERIDKWLYVERISVITTKDIGIDELRHQITMNMRSSPGNYRRGIKSFYLGDLGINFGSMANIPLSIRCWQDGLFGEIENSCQNSTCVQHVFMYLMLIGGYERIRDDGNYIEVENKYSVYPQWADIFLNYQNLSDFYNQVSNVYDGQNYLDDEDIVRSTLQMVIVNYQEPMQIIDQFDIWVSKEYEEIKLVAINGHIFPVHRELIENIQRYFNLQGIDEIQTKCKNDYSMGGKEEEMECIPEKYQRNDKEFNARDFISMQSKDYFEQYYKTEKGKCQLVKTCQRIYLYYDIETTTKHSKKLGEIHVMQPYLVCSHLVCFQEYDDPRIKNGDEQIFKGENCVLQFINYIEKILFYLMRLKHNVTKIIVLGWNARKFDTQFLIEEVFKRYPRCCSMTGTVSNPKSLVVGEWLEFWDAMDMCSPQSLQSFCKSMGVEGKFDCPEILQVDSLDKWEEIQEEEMGKKITDYCMQDVRAMVNGMSKFNQTCIQILNDLRGSSIKLESENFILEKTMAKFSFKIFTKYLIPDALKPTPIKESSVFRAFQKSYRGGFVQAFIFGKMELQEGSQERIYYIDVNSLYPSVMQQSDMPLEFCDQIIKHSGRYSQVCPYSLYAVTEFDVKDAKPFYGFFGVKVYENGKEVKTIYPKKWQGNDQQGELWCYGSEILLFQKVFPAGILVFSKEIRCIRKGRMFATIGEMYNRRSAIKKTNPPLAQTLKILMNSAYGRFGMKAYEKGVFVLNNLEEFINIQEKEYYEARMIEEQFQKASNEIIENFKEFQTPKIQQKCLGVNSKLFKYTFYEEGQYMPNNINQRITFIASFISNQSRNRLLATLYQFGQSGMAKILYCDTDSIVYKTDSIHAKESLEKLDPYRWGDLQSQSFTAATKFGSALGEMKHEVEDPEEISCFECYGPKFYRYQTFNRENGIKKWNFKTKGVSQKTGEDCDIQFIFDRFFNIFQKSLRTQIQQFQIKKKGGIMTAGNNIKVNSYNYTRKLMEMMENYNETDAFDDITEYLNYCQKDVKWNGKAYVYV